MVGKHVSRKAKRYLNEQGRIETQLDSGKNLRSLIPIQKRKILKKCFWGVVVVCGFWAFATFLLISWIGEQPDPQSLLNKIWPSWMALLFVLLLWRTGYQILYFISYFYDIDDRSVVIRKGVMAQREITLPFSKITDVYVDQDALDWIFGLWDVHISSPTATSGRFAHIDGVDQRGAVLLRSLILDRIHDEDDSIAANKEGAHGEESDEDSEELSDVESK